VLLYPTPYRGYVRLLQLARGRESWLLLAQNGGWGSVVVDIHDKVWPELKLAMEEFQGAGSEALGLFAAALENLAATGDPLDEQPPRPPIRAFIRYLYPDSALWVYFADRISGTSRYIVLHLLRVEGPATRAHPPLPPDAAWVLALNRLRHP